MPFALGLAYNQPMDRRRRKLLSASVGVAAVSYVLGAACGGETTGSSSGNPTSGNLPAPPPTVIRDAADEQLPPVSGNLPAPPPMDAGDGGDADAATSDAGDASSD